MLNANDSTKWQGNIAIGMYEAFSVGVKYNYKPNLGISASIGSQFRTYKNQKYIIFTLANEWTFRHKDKSLSNWSFDQKIMYWSMEDHWYKWKVLSMEPAISRTWKLTENLGLKLDGGPVFMVVLGFKRKTFEEVGWSQYFNVNVTGRLTYDIE